MGPWASLVLESSVGLDLCLVSGLVSLVPRSTKAHLNLSILGWAGPGLGVGAHLALGSMGTSLETKSTEMVLEPESVGAFLVLGQALSLSPQGPAWY